MPLRCPVCKAENSTPPACRRCKADLALLFAVEADRERCLYAARVALREGRWVEAQWQAARADGLRHDAEAARLRAVAALLGGDPAEAWRQYQRAAAAA